MGPIGCIPYQKTINGVGETECVGLPNKLALQYNGKLRELLTELNENLPGAKFVLANVYDLVMELITNYEKHGEQASSSPHSAIPLVILSYFTNNMMRDFVPCVLL